MAEFGVIASIITLAGSGIKVSIILFDLADRIGSAGEEVKLLATEVTLFCSVLQAVQNALEDPAGSHSTPAALQLVDQVVQHCKSIIDEIGDIVSSLAKEEGLSDFPTLEWTGRVKWTFKRTKVQVKRQTLESCKSTLHLLLTTLRWSRRFSSDRLPTSEEGQQYKMITQGLVLTTRASFDNLRALEDAADNDQAELPGEANRTPMSRFLNGLSLSAKEPAQTTKLRRTSTWLDKLVFDQAPAPNEPHPGQRQHRLSSATTAKDPLILLRKWTENRPHRIVTSLEAESTSMFNESNFRFVGDSHPDEPMKLSRAPTFAISPKSTMIPPQAEIPIAAALTFPAIEESAGTRWRDGSSDEWLSLVLREFGLQQRHRADFQLLIAYGGNTRILSPKDKPHTIFEDLTKYDLRPQLLVRHAKPGSPNGLNACANEHVLADVSSFTVSPTTVKFATDHVQH